MFTPKFGDVILRATIAGGFFVMDALNKHCVAGPLSLREAVAYAQAHGAPNIFQQPVDERGRIMGDPLRLAWS